MNRTYLAVLALPLLCLPDPARSADLIPHHAFYSLSLGSNHASSGVVEASGGMAIEVTETCEGWITKQRLSLRIVRGEGDEVVNDNSFSSWESKDGLRYRFSVRDKLTGEADENLRGSAELKPHGGAGVANFIQPDRQRITLPKGTLFPTAHVSALIDAARAGTRIFHRVVFDGSTADGPDYVNVVIGRPVPLEKLPGLDRLIGRPTWPTRWAFFPIKSTSPTPDYELDMRMLENGVVVDVGLVYEDFEVHGKLQYFEALPRPRC